MTITQADFEDAARRTAILERELDITNADHIALWLEASRPLDNAISWLACRIIEAHEIEIAKAVRAAEARAREEGAKAMQFQPSVDAWMDACFGEPIKSDQLERCDRFIEEALELAQTCNAFTIDRAHALVDYVFNRDQGEINQEVGGVMVTLAALCNTAGVDMLAAADTELARVWTKVEQIRAKQAAKPTGSALPIATLDPAQIAGGKP